MTKQAAGFLRRNGIDASNVICILREDGKTVIVLTDKRRKETYIPLKALTEEFPENVFQLVNKGVALSSRHIVNIAGRTFTMSDGSQFEGRLRGSILTSPQSVVAPLVENERRGISSRFAVMDTMPIAFCVFGIDEKRDDAKGLLLYYCNNSMAKLLGVDVAAAMGRPFRDVVDEGNTGLISLCAEMLSLASEDALFEIFYKIAKEGQSRIIPCRTSNTDHRVMIYCSQPQEGFCSCAFSIS